LPESSCSVPVSALVGFLAAWWFNYVVTVVRELALPGGRMVGPVIFQAQAALTREKQAIGLDLMLTALAAQVAVAMASFEESKPNPLVQQCAKRAIEQGTLNWVMLGSLVIVVLLFSMVIRHYGYEAPGLPKWDWGVNIPKWTGILSITAVYLLSPTGGT
jgi:hypothetical protein